MHLFVFSLKGHRGRDLIDVRQMLKVKAHCSVTEQQMVCSHLITLQLFHILFTLPVISPSASCLNYFETFKSRSRLIVCLSCLFWPAQCLINCIFCLPAHSSDHKSYDIFTMIKSSTTASLSSSSSLADEEKLGLFRHF